MKLKASALLFTLVISLVVCLLLSSFILIEYLNKTYLITCENHEKVRSNVMEGLNLLLADASLMSDGETKNLDLFGRGNDSVRLSKQGWGVFEVITSEAHAGTYVANKSAIVGDDMGKQKLALYLADQERPLSICGDNIIRGNTYLPKAGVKIAFIEGQSFTGTKMVEGTVNTSERELPKPNAEMLKSLDAQLTLDQKQVYSSVPDSFTNSFREPAVTYYFENEANITATLKGNIKIISKKAVVIEPQAVLKDVLVIAPYVKIRKSFKGSLQVFATDSLTVEEDVELKYPSALVLQSSSQNPGYIKLNENSRINGLICSLPKGNIMEGMQGIILAKNTTVTGLIYSSGPLQVKGKVYGSVYTQSFILKTPSSVYENHLLSAEINSEKLPPYFVIPSIVAEETGKKKILKWAD